MADSQIACPWPNCNSQCPACGGSRVVWMHEPGDVYAKERFHTGLQLIGTGEVAFRRLCRTALELIQFREANSCCFTRAYASVEESPAVHAPLVRSCVRKPLDPWSATLCVDRLWRWLCGAAPVDIELPLLRPGQQYVHVPVSGAMYPEAPPWAGPGGKNEGRESDYIFHRSFLIRDQSFSDVHSLAVFPVWARWGAFSNEEPER